MNYLKLIIVFLYFFNNYFYGQQNISLLTSITESASFNYRGTGNVYPRTVFSLGMQYNKFNVTIDYQFSGLYSFDISDPYDYNDHLLGLSFEYQLREIEKKINPFVLLRIGTQIGSNYKNGILTEHLRTTNGNRDVSLQNLAAYYGVYYFVSYENYDAFVGNIYYQSTPIVSSFILGADFELFKGLHVNLGAGIGLQDVKIRRPVSKDLINNWMLTFDTQVGLTYAIPLKKKETFE